MLYAIKSGCMYCRRWLHQDLKVGAVQYNVQPRPSNYYPLRYKLLESDLNLRKSRCVEYTFSTPAKVTA